MRVTALTLYPVKSLGGVALDASPLDARGLRGDRRWGLVDVSGGKVTAREVKGLLGLSAEPAGQTGQTGQTGSEGAIRLRDRAGGSLVVAAPREATPIVVDHSGQGTARPAGREVHAWISERVGTELRLVWQDDASLRPVRQDRGGRTGDTNSLADAAPILLTTGASLRRLNGWLAETGAEPIGHERFRPNVVVDGTEPFAEDQWDEVRIGDVAFHRTMVCDRCVMTTIDRQTLRTTKEPIRTLSRHRKWDGATWFGIRLAPDLPLPADAHLRVGDEVRASAGP
jgi:uncharacterized protein YcbX